MQLPYMKSNSGASKQQIVNFGGLNLTNGAQAGELRASTNMASDRFPFLAPRKSRAIQGAYTQPTALFGWNGLLIVDGTSLLYNGEVVGTITPGEKQFAVVNTKLCIFPDKKYLDLTNNQFKSLDASITSDPESVTFGADYIEIDFHAPPETGDLSFPYSEGSEPKVKTYTALSWSEGGGWVKTGEAEVDISDVAVGALLIPSYVASSGAYVLNTKTGETWSGTDNNNGVYFTVTAANDAEAPSYRWEKWSAIASSYTYYLSSGFSFVTSSSRDQDFTGSASYSFNSSTGQYAVSGSKTIPLGSSGTAYGGGGTSVYRYDVGPNSLSIYYAERQGPYSGTSYSQGSTFHGYVYGEDGDYPDGSYKLVDGAYYWFKSRTAIAYDRTMSIAYASTWIDAVSDLTDYFKAGDVVNISGCTTFTENNKSDLAVTSVSADRITFEADVFSAGEEVGTVNISRPVPDLSYICSSDNRLWGVQDQIIYGSKLSDPTNFNSFANVAGDSFTAAVGSEGEFTGCIAYSGDVLFFKENLLYKLLGKTPLEYTLYPYNVAGLQAGAHKSLQIINEILYYKSRSGVYTYSGGTPQLISYALGLGQYSGATAGTDGIKYYISMQDSSGTWGLYVYDTLRQVWLREDDTHAADFAYHGGSLYILDIADGVVMRAGSGDEAVEWSAEFVEFTETVLNRKVYSKLLLRMDLEAGSTLKIEISVDGTAFKQVYLTHNQRAQTLTLPLPPMRCDSLRVRLSGKGECVIKSMVREYRTRSEA